MEEEIETGGPAFPVAGMVSSIATEDDYRRLSGHASASGLTVSEWIARDAFKQADAMLKAREVK